MSIATPPPTSLSEPASPTELPSASFDSSNQDSDRLDEMSKSRPIYLIVATTVSPPLGIGLKGTLPWGPLRADMAFFKRVTTESRPRLLSEMQRSKSVNAVIMGRKTWDGIPPRFRPLKARLNIIVTRSGPELANSIVEELNSKPKGAPGSQVYTHNTVLGTTSSIHVSSYHDPDTSVLVMNSFDSTLEVCDDPSKFSAALSQSPSSHLALGNVFVIGGSEIYNAALCSSKFNQRMRILQTEVRRRDEKEIKCDTFFPNFIIGKSGRSEFTEVPQDTLGDWAGTSIPQGDGEWKIDGEMEIRVLGWEATESAPL